MDDQRESRVDQPIRIIVNDDSRLTVLLPTALVAAAVLLALLKPWGGTPVGPGAAAASGEVATPAPGGTLERTARPRATPDDYAELVVTCGSPGGWRAATIQRWSGRRAPIRAWAAVEPVVAEHAMDPGIPFVPVATDLVAAIGYCAPRRADDTPHGVDPEIWLVEDGGATRVDGSERLEPLDANPLGGLWLPLADRAVSLEGVAGWPPGRYAIRLDFGSVARWFGIEIDDLVRHGGATASPRPSESPDGRASASP